MGYDTDLTDEEWKRLQPLLPKATDDPRIRNVDLRAVLNGILYVEATKVPWSHLPAEFPPWPLTYSYAHRWGRVGRLRKIAWLLKRGPKTVPKPPSPTTRRKSLTRASPQGHPRREAPLLTQDEIAERVEAVKARRKKVE